LPSLKNIGGTKTGSSNDITNGQPIKPVDSDMSMHSSTWTSQSQKTQLSFAAFTDTHIGIRYQHPLYSAADHLDRLGDDLINGTNLLDFAVHLGDIVNQDTAQVNGQGLPPFVNQYKNNVKAYLISHVNIPLFCVLGNHDLDDYRMNYNDPHNLSTSLIDELSMNNPVYAMMRSGILFLIVPELGYITWTHPVEYKWIRYMTQEYPTTTTIIFSHQAIEDTTKADSAEPYWGKQDMDWWANLFQQNPQIKMWIHGHTHELDWYQSNHSTGETYPVRDFGHAMVFSSPYPQMNWNNDSVQDRIVIYNLSSEGVTTATWEETGAGGHWTTGYAHVWNITTTFDPNATNWYSFPMFLQDNETQLTDMKVLSPDVTLQLVGTQPMELFFDPRMESPSSKEATHEVILGFGNDRLGNVNWTNPGMRVHGPTYITFPEKLPHNALQEDGRSGQPYHSFPMGTICAAVPGQTYNITMTARCQSGNGTLHLTMDCSDWGMRTHYSTLENSSQQVIAHTFGSEYETIYGIYTVPKDVNAWFLQGRLDFLNSTDYDVSLFSVKRQRTSDTTDDFHLHFNDHWYNISGSLADHETVNFSVNPNDLSDARGVMNFTAFIQGNRYGMVNLVYHEPLLMGMNARFRVDSYHDGVFNLSLTKTITRTSAIEMMLWNSTFFKTYPLLSELLVRLLKKTLVNNILETILSLLIPSTFKLYPFNTNPMYAQVTITTDDESAVKHTTHNGNLWFSCNGPTIGERQVQVTLPGR
jgi:predicted phosphodiesterase